MSTAKPIQLILARQLASCVAMPVLLLDAEGTLIYYNEPAEPLVGQRFEETGEIPADEWPELVIVADENRALLSADERPMRAALLQRRPISMTIWTHTPGSEWRHIRATAFPLVGEGDKMLGVMNIF